MIRLFLFSSLSGIAIALGYGLSESSSAMLAILFLFFAALLGWLTSSYSRSAVDSEFVWAVIGLMGAIAVRAALFFAGYDFWKLEALLSALLGIRLAFVVGIHLRKFPEIEEWRFAV